MGGGGSVDRMSCRSQGKWLRTMYYERANASHMIRCVDRSCWCFFLGGAGGGGFGRQVSFHALDSYPISLKTIRPGFLAVVVSCWYAW